MTRAELLARRASGQYLTRPADKLTVVRDLCGVQAQFFTNAVHALKIRCSNFEKPSFQNGLVKNWTIRGTMHVFAESDLPIFLHCNDGRDYRRNDWVEQTFWSSRSSWVLTPERQAYFSDLICQAVANAPRLREELKEICRAAGMTEAEESCMFDQWGGGIRLLCERGFLNYSASEEKRFCPSPPFVPIPRREADLELARRYFTHFGPASLHDAMYFFRVTAAQVRQWLADLPVSVTECDGRTYYWIDHVADCPDFPGVCFLAGFDQFLLGYEKKESLCFAQEHLRGIFNLAGIVMPSVLCHGRIIGRWKQHGKRIGVETFTEISVQEERLIKNAAETLWPEMTALKFSRL